MRAFLAVIRDSLHEAMASRVLWLLLAGSTLVLLTLVPLGISDVVPKLLQPMDLVRADDFYELVKADGQGNADTPAKRIWERIPQDKVQKLDEALAAESTGREFRVAREIIGILNEYVIPDPQFYNKDAFLDLQLTQEGQDLCKLDATALTDEQVQRRNRLLLVGAFNRFVLSGPPQLIQVKYLAWEFELPVPLKKSTAVTAIVQFFTKTLVGIIGIFSAIVVTSSIIPQMFEPGAADLLLSKPVSRAMLFLAKFAGGCLFTFINAAYVLIGLWLICGLRLGEWIPGLLLCIPVFMFVFAIYYAVSALAGVIWRNAIICVVFSVLLFVMCWAVGFSFAFLEQNFTQQERQIRLAKVGEGLVGINEAGEFRQWDSHANAWQPLFAYGIPRQNQFPFFNVTILGPIYDAQRERVYLSSGNLAQFGQLGGTLSVGVRQQNDWIVKPGVAMPLGSIAMHLNKKQELLAVGSQGVFQLIGDPLAETKYVELPFVGQVPLLNAAVGFEQVSGSLTLSSDSMAAFDSQTDEVAVATLDTVYILAPNESGRYKERLRLTPARKRPSVITFGGNRLVLTYSDGELAAFDAQAGAPVALENAAGMSALEPRFAEQSPDGRWHACVFHNGKLRLYDATADKVFFPEIALQGKASACRIDSQGQLDVAHEFGQVTSFDLQSLDEAGRIRPTRPILQRLFTYVITPLHTVFPKPGELDNLSAHLLAGDDDTVVGANATAAKVKVDIWGPVWSNLAFVGVLLAISCAYVSWKDF